MTGENSIDGHVPISKNLPKTLDGGREVGAAAMIVGAPFSIWVSMSVEDPFLLAFALVAIWTSLFFVGAMLLQKLRRRRVEERAKAEEAYHRMISVETDRKMSEAKASGVFDKFGA